MYTIFFSSLFFFYGRDPQSFPGGMDWIVSPPPNAYVETLSPNVIVFGDRAFKEAVKFKWGHKDEILTWLDWCLIRRGRDTRDLSPLSLSLPAHSQKKGHVRTWQEGGHLQDRKRPHEKPTLTAPWSGTFSLQNCEKIGICCLSHSVYSVWF